MQLHSGIGSGSLAGVHPDSLVPAVVTIPRLAVQMGSLSDMVIFRQSSIKFRPVNTVMSHATKDFLSDGPTNHDKICAFDADDASERRNTTLSRAPRCKVISRHFRRTLSFRNWEWTVLKRRCFGLQNRRCEAPAHEHILQEFSMPSPEIAQALLAPETQKALSLPMAALIFCGSLTGGDRNGDC